MRPANPAYVFPLIMALALGQPLLTPSNFIVSNGQVHTTPHAPANAAPAAEDNGKSAIDLIKALTMHNPDIKLSQFDVHINMRFGDKHACGRCGGKHADDKCDAPKALPPPPPPAPGPPKAEEAMIEPLTTPPPPPPPAPTTPAPTTTPEPPPTTTRPTCAATKTLSKYGLCNGKIPTGKNATRDCQAQCYVADQAHFRGASCDLDHFGKRTSCRCFFDPCRNSEMDVIFLLDSSASLSLSEFNQEITFIQNFVSKMALGSDKSRVGLVQFSTTAQERFSFLSVDQSQSSILTQLRRISHEYGMTNITGAFQEAAPLLSSTKRDNVPQLIVLVTDGLHNQGITPPSVPASQLRSQGVWVYAIGIGSGVSKDSLVEITAEEDHVFTAQFGSDLNNAVNIIGAEVTAKVNN